MGAEFGGRFSYKVAILLVQAGVGLDNAFAPAL